MERGLPVVLGRDARENAPLAEQLQALSPVDTLALLAAVHAATRACLTHRRRCMPFRISVSLDCINQAFASRASSSRRTLLLPSTTALVGRSHDHALHLECLANPVSAVSNLVQQPPDPARNVCTTVDMRCDAMQWQGADGAWGGSAGGAVAAGGRQRGARRRSGGAAGSVGCRARPLGQAPGRQVPGCGL